jgi:glycosyltransferase involved in cell wall biosynthesis
VSKQQNKRVLYILFGKEASSFVRALVYKDEYRKREIHVNYFQVYSISLLRAIEYFKSFYPIQFVVRVLNKLYFLYRQFVLLKIVKKYDVIIAVKYVNSRLLERIKSLSNALLIYDFDDAVWLNLFFGNNEFSKIVTIADCITSDNSYLANYAALYNKYSCVLNGPCQIEKFIEYRNKSIKISESQNEKITIGWIGGPATLFYLYKIYDALEIIGQKYPDVILKLVGTGKERLLLPPFEKIKVITVSSYDQNEMISQIYSFDIGLYPLFLNELSLGRGSLKATVYMSGRVPVICSALGENVKIIQNGINGFLASSTEEWIEKLSLLIENAALRKEIGENGFNYAKANYSINSCLNNLFEIIRKTDQ